MQWSPDHWKRKCGLTPTRFNLSETNVYSFFGFSTLGGGSSSTTSTKGQQHILQYQESWKLTEIVRKIMVKGDDIDV